MGPNTIVKPHTVPNTSASWNSHAARNFSTYKISNETLTFEIKYWCCVENYLKKNIVIQDKHSTLR